MTSLDDENVIRKAIISAASAGDYVELDQLLHAFSNNTMDETFDLAIMEAIRNGHSSTVNLLIPKLRPPTCPFDTRMIRINFLVSIVNLAATLGHANMVRAILDHFRNDSLELQRETYIMTAES